MVSAIEYRAMAAEPHRFAGMCRSPQSREEHLRLEKQLLAFADLALADNAECLGGADVLQNAEHSPLIR
jgi:hypothetical protein